MKRIQKIGVLIFSLVIGVYPLCAIDGGASIAAGVDIQTPIKLPNNPIGVKNFERVNGYLQQNMDKDGNYNFYLDTSYLFLFSGNFYKNKKNTNIKNIVDVDQLNFSFLFPLSGGNAVSFIFGRFPQADYTNTIFKQKLDGATVALDFQNVQAEFTLGYTGLLNTYTNPLYVMPRTYTNTVYSLAPAFIAANAKTNFFVGKYGHRIGLEFMSFVQPKKKPGYQIYGTVSADGQIIPRLIFDLSTTIALRKYPTDKKLQLGGLVIGDLAYYFKPLDAAFGFRALYASGANAKTGEGAFTGFSRLALSKISGQLPSDVVSLGLFGSLKPLDNLLIKLTADTYLKGSKPQNDEKKFSGFQWGGALDYVLLQSLCINCELGHFVGEKGRGAFLGSLKCMLTF